MFECIVRYLVQDGCFGILLLSYQLKDGHQQPLTILLLAQANDHHTPTQGGL